MSSGVQLDLDGQGVRVEETRATLLPQPKAGVSHTSALFRFGCLSPESNKLAYLENADPYRGWFIQISELFLFGTSATRSWVRPLAQPRLDTLGRNTSGMNQSQITLDPPIAPPARRTPSGSYAQLWPAYNRAQVHEKDELMILLRELCRGVEEPPRPATGRPSLPRRDMVCAAVLKVYAARSARRFMCELEVARERSLITHIPHYNSVLNVMANESLTPVFQQLVTESALPLRVVERFFAADSTSLGTRVRRTWYDRRDERYRTRQETVKLHVMIGAKTHVITHAVVSNGTAADSPFFRELVRNTASNFDLLEVSADAGYLAAENMRETLMAGAIPYIAFRSNSTGSGLQAKSAFWEGC